MGTDHYSGLADRGSLAADLRWQRYIRARVEKQLRDSQADGVAMALQRDEIRRILAEEPPGTVHPAVAETWGHLRRRILTILDRRDVPDPDMPDPRNLWRPSRWDRSVPPGGLVCAVPRPDRADGICGTPIESEPCTDHDDMEDTP